MTCVQSHLTAATTFNSFFGPIILQPGLNPNLNDRLWRNLKNNNADVQALLAKGILVEVEEN